MEKVRRLAPRARPLDSADRPAVDVEFEGVARASGIGHSARTRESGDGMSNLAARAQGSCSAHASSASRQWDDALSLPQPTKSYRAARQAGRHRQQRGAGLPKIDRASAS